MKYIIKIVDYLDVTLNLNNTYKPLPKPNNEINYTYEASNHPPPINKQIPPGKVPRLWNVSSSDKIFMSLHLFNKKH